MLESIMRYTSVAVAAALTMLTVSTALHSQRVDDQIDPRSMALLAQARQQQAAGKLDDATDTLQTALAVDPRNRGAFVALGDVSRARGMPGEAIAQYRAALKLEPHDLAALQGEGEALVQRGAITLAKTDLATIHSICKTNACPQAAALSAALAKGPPADAPALAAAGNPAKAGSGKE
jgi:cytochrome c-type biogenesis protein CcmH/NrfG